MRPLTRKVLAAVIRRMPFVFRWGLFSLLILTACPEKSEAANSAFRVPPHIDQQLRSESTPGILNNCVSSGIINLGMMTVILATGQLTRQISAGYLPVLGTMLASEGVMHGIDCIRDYYSSDSSIDFAARAGLSNIDLSPYSRYLPWGVRYLLSLGYGLKDSISRVISADKPGYSRVYFHKPELNNDTSIIWIPSELADQYDNTAPGQGYFRVTPLKKRTDCGGQLPLTFDEAVRQPGCVIDKDSEYYVHIYPRRIQSENRLLFRPFRQRLAGELYISPYFYGGGERSRFITEPSSQHFNHPAFSPFYGNGTDFAESSEQCFNREHQAYANPLHHSTFLLITDLLTQSQQYWQPRMALFQSLDQELDYAGVLEPVPSNTDKQLIFNSLESESLTLVSAGKKGYLSIDRHKSHRHPIIMSLETVIGYPQVRGADLEHLQQQRNALWNEQWQLMFNLFTMVASHLLTRQALNTKPAKYFFDVQDSVEPDSKNSKAKTPDEGMLQAGKGGNGGGATNKGSGSAGDAPSRNTRSRKRQNSSNQFGNDDLSTGNDNTPPPPRHPAYNTRSATLANEGLKGSIPVKTRKLDNGNMEITVAGPEELPHGRKQSPKVSSESEGSPPRCSRFTGKGQAEEEERLEREMYLLFRKEMSSGNSDSSRSPTPEPPLQPVPIVPDIQEDVQIHTAIASGGSLPVGSVGGNSPLGEHKKTVDEPASSVDVQIVILLKSRDSSGSVQNSKVSPPVSVSVSPVPRSSIQAPLEPQQSEIPKTEVTATVHTDVAVVNKFYCPFEGCNSPSGEHTKLETPEKLRTHINGHIRNTYFQTAKAEISVGKKVAIEQKNMACRINQCNRDFDSATTMGNHLQKDHSGEIDNLSFNDVFSVRFDLVQQKLTKPKRGAAKRKIPFKAVHKGQASFSELLATARDRRIPLRGFYSSDPLSEMTPAGAAKNYVTRFGDGWLCSDCGRGDIRQTPEGLGAHFNQIHFGQSFYWCPGAGHTHKDGKRPSFTDGDGYFQHLWSHKPATMTDEDAGKNGWMSLESDFNPFTPYKP